MSQSRPNGRPSAPGKSVPPTSRRSARQQRLANREANRALSRAGTSGSSGGGLGTLMLWTAIAIVIGVVVIGGAYMLTSKSSNGSSYGSPIPARVVTSTDVPTSGQTLGYTDAKLTVDVYSDFQCPNCLAFALETEPTLVDKYVKTHKIKIVYRDFLVIDGNTGGHESLDAANAARCAADQGKFWLYHDVLYANQHREGSGAFTKDRLKTMGGLIGLDMSTFGTCVDNGQHNAEIQTAQTSVPTDAQGTPAVYVVGKLVANFDTATISAAIDAALNPASPSPSVAATPSASAAATGAPTASPS
jgi:protein-disulfide isomerase